MLAGNPIVQSGVISSPLRALAGDGYPVFHFCRRAFKTYIENKKREKTRSRFIPLNLGTDRFSASFIHLYTKPHRTIE